MSKYSAFLLDFCAIPIPNCRNGSLFPKIEKGQALLSGNRGVFCRRKPPYEFLCSVFGNSQEDFLISAVYPDWSSEKFQRALVAAARSMRNALPILRHSHPA